jgi:hypothetical protein
MGAKNCLIHAPDRLVVLLGLENTVVVDTPTPCWWAISIVRKKSASSSMS